MNSVISPGVPRSLVIAAAVTAIEGLVLVALAVLEIADLTGGRMTMGLTTAAFFVAFGALLMACAWLITHGHTWPRGPILLTQLIALGLAWNLRGGDTTLLALTIALIALIVLAGMLHPASIEAINSQDS